MALGVICIISDAKKDDLNKVFEAMGIGPETFTRKLCTINPSATYETPPTHWLMSMVNASEEDVAIWQAMTAGNLPQLPTGLSWGEDDIISEVSALAASAGNVFHVYSAAGDIVPVDHANAILESEGLQFVPDPPL